MIATTIDSPAPAGLLVTWLQAFLTGESTPAPDVEPAPHETVDLQDPLWVDSQFPAHAMAKK